MAIKKRTNRDSQVITTNITPINQALKAKLSAALQEVANKIKEKHLS